VLDEEPIFKQLDDGEDVTPLRDQAFVPIEDFPSFFKAGPQVLCSAFPIHRA